MIAAPDRTHAIDLARVEKTYKGKIRALRGITMRVRPGEVFGLLGPNGAGKSTLVKILMSVIRPTRCEGTLLGRPVGETRTLSRVGYLPEHHRFPPYLTGAQVLDYCGAMSGVPRRLRSKRLPGLLELVGMGGSADRKIGGYSKGMRQRIGIAQALINDPELVLLDEPTDGVDPVGRRDIRAVCARLKAEGRTVFINTHLLSELELVCDRVAILVGGLIRRQGTLDELVLGQERYEVEVSGEPGAAGEALRRAAQAAGSVDASKVVVEGSTLRLPGASEAAVQPLIRGLIESGATIRSVRPVRPTLEDLFLQAVEDGGTDEPGGIRGVDAGAARDGGVAAGPGVSPAAGDPETEEAARRAEGGES